MILIHGMATIANFRHLSWWFNSLLKLSGHILSLYYDEWWHIVMRYIRKYRDYHHNIRLGYGRIGSYKSQYWFTKKVFVCFKMLSNARNRSLYNNRKCLSVSNVSNVSSWLIDWMQNCNSLLKVSVFNWFWFMGD